MIDNKIIKDILENRERTEHGKKTSKRNDLRQRI